MERIAVGGMAEIFRAKSRSLAGFEKVLAIKRLHPRYGEDVDFIKMLIEEARISVGLAHVNIAQIFDLDKMIREFSWDRVSTSAPIFDTTKLEWLNGMYIRELSVDDLAGRLRPFAAEGRLDGPHASKMVEIIQERMKTLSEFDQWTWFFFTDDLPYEPELLIAKKMAKEGTIEALEASVEAFGSVTDWTAEALEALGRELCEQLGLKIGQLFMTLRIAITGSAKSPPLFESMEILGEEPCMARLREALARIAG